MASLVSDLDLQERDGGVSLRVRVKPRASKSRVLGVRGGALEVAVAAPPVDGEANAELVATLARHFAVARSKVRVVTGAGSRNKLVSISGLTAPSARAKAEG
jgi:uncharacterized protein